MINKSLTEEEYILTRYQTILKKQGIQTVADLIMNFPYKYEDYHVSSLEGVQLDENLVLEGTVVSKVTVNYLKNKLTTIVFQLALEGRKVRCTIFNRAFLKNKINYGTVMRVQGRFYQNFNNFTVNDLIILDEINREIVPVYHIKEISEGKYLEFIEKLYRRYKNHLPETLPQQYLHKHQLPSMTETVRFLHFPDTMQDIEKGTKRIKYEELLKYQLSMKYLHLMREQNKNCPVINYDLNQLKQLQVSLSYQLTVDQQKAVDEILTDLKSPYPMNRLLQGEVGSGKTIVAVMALLAVVSGGYQAALMCPTEILSTQHFNTLQETFKIFPAIRIELLTGSTPAKNRREILDDLASGAINIIVGTHALFQKDVEYQALGIVVADEEHRFGVKQRVLIKNKGLDVNYLKMSATPIPRTLAISVYGDTDISIIKSMPANRKAVITKYVSGEGKREVLEHLKEMLRIGHQIYMVTPLIDESEAIDSANAIDIYERMTKYFAGQATVGLIHGRLKTEEKEDIMKRFLNKEIDILVATSVIEVGVNVANATTIVVLGAERFGVATLHQLRGRVMRSDAVPYCFYISDNVTENSEKRLKMVESTTDGFLLAEYDLKYRGPGEFFGEKQSGSMNFKYANIQEDGDLLEIANSDSDEIIHSKNLFENPEYEYLREYVHNNYIIKTSELD